MLYIFHTPSIQNIIWILIDNGHKSRCVKNSSNASPKKIWTRYAAFFLSHHAIELRVKPDIKFIIISSRHDYWTVQDQRTACPTT